MIFLTTKRFVTVALIAAIYTALSLVLAPISYGPIQVRIAEALTVLPLIYEPSILGVTIGCFLTNLIGAIMGVNPTGILDAIVGTFATFMAAILTHHFRNRKIHGIPFLSLSMPIVWNFVIIGIELGVLLFPDNIMMGSLICGAEVAVGEMIAVIFGWFLVKLLERTEILKEQEL